MPDEKVALNGVGKHKTIPSRMDHGPIPPDCYHTGSEYYNPNTKCLYDVNDPSVIVRIPTLAEEAWIVNNCPRAVGDRVAFRSELLETHEKEHLDDQGLVYAHSAESCEKA